MMYSHPMSEPEVWLRGPLAGYDPMVMPVAHSLLQVREDLARLETHGRARQLWARPGGAASIGFHVRHTGGALDRLLTYARGETLDARSAVPRARGGARRPPRPLCDARRRRQRHHRALASPSCATIDPRRLLDERAWAGDACRPPCSGCWCTRPSIRRGTWGRRSPLRVSSVRRAEFSRCTALRSESGPRAATCSSSRGATPWPKKTSADYETYIATSTARGPRGGGRAAVAASAYKIEVRFLGGLTTAQKNAFKTAADRWANVIVGDLPSVRVDGEVIDDLLILAQGTAIDGPRRHPRAGRSHAHPSGQRRQVEVPAGEGHHVVRHRRPEGDAEGRHAEGRHHPRDGPRDRHRHHLGAQGPAEGCRGRTPCASSARTPARSSASCKKSKAADVPVENTGGPGTADGHWRESVFRNELMSGFIAAPNNPLSRLTVASLQDLGYEVDLSKAEPYKLPDLFAVAAAGATSTHDEPHALPIIPMVVPDEQPDRVARAVRRVRVFRPA